MKPQTESRKNNFFVYFFGTGFYSGLFPIASGTFGSLAALLIYLIPNFENIFILSSAIIIFFLIGIYTAGEMELVYGHDPSIVVIDEFVGMWISLIFIPKIWFFILVAFLLFRFFDITKIFPASYFDKQKGGFAIMMDDVVAGIFALIFSHVFVKVYYLLF